MYILFINSSGKCDLPPKKKKSSKCDIFFSAQFNNNSNKKKNYPNHGFNPTQPNACGLCWIGLDLCDGLSWVGLNFF